jgi:hypothetical protein
MIMSRRMSWTGKSRMHTRYWWTIQKERDHQEDEAGGWIILKWILRR